MAETIPQQINRLRDVLTRVAEGTYTADDMPLLDLGNATLSLDEKLLALHMAVIQNTLNTVKNRHEQIAIGMVVSKYVTFFARQIIPDISFWTEEVNGDIDLQTNLFLNAQSDVETLVRHSETDPEIVQVTKNQQLLLSEFQKRQQRRIDGQMLYDAIEAPPSVDAGAAETKLRFLRQTQMREALQEIQLLADRAIFAVKRIHLVKSTIMPLFAQAQDPAADSWEKDIEATTLKAQEALSEAADTHNHLSRLHSFGPRLEVAKKLKPE